MTTRRRALAALGAGLASIPFAARAQPVPGLPRLGILHPASVEASAVYTALVPGLAERGYVNGKNIVLELRSGNGKREMLEPLVADLLRSNVDLLLVVGPAAVTAASVATRTIPIIAVDLESDPVRNGWMKSLSRPGGNVTGFFLDLTGMSAKWLQLLREAVPGVRRISLLWDTSTGEAQLAATTAAAAAFAVQVQTVPIENWAEFDAAVDAAVRARTQAFVVLSSPSAFQASAQFAQFTLRNRIPAISPFRPFAAAGGLMSYGPDLDAFFRRTAFTIERILKGAKPADVAVEQPTKYEFVINHRTAESLRLPIPQSLLLRADEVIR
jgi:putative ABC transport system substrate-binding protein